MAIQEDAIIGPDTTVTLESAQFNGTMVNRDQVSTGFTKVVSDFNPAQSSVDGYVIMRDKADDIVIRGKRGLGETFMDIQLLFTDEVITNFVTTDFPDHAAMTTKYGPLGCIGVKEVQTDQPGTYDITLRYGLRTHGYTSAA